jgi:cell division protein FtsI (penicillin-binding protein 3)
VKRPPVRRLVAMLTVAVLALGIVVVRLAVLQFGEAGALAAVGAQQRLRTYELTANRGAILDRAGTPLAITVEARDVYADPRFVVDPAATAAAIAPILQVRRAALRGQLGTTGSFVYLARQIDVAVADRIADLALPGIGFLDSARRYYPAGTVAAQVLGFVGTDGVGLSGLEAQHEDFLAGTPGEETVEVSAQGQAIAGGARAGNEPVPGDDLILTIDREIQFQAQRYLREAVESNGAKGGTVVVMDPMTGDIYAMASYPSFDPNDFLAFPVEARMNRALTDAWEPGSVNKIVTAATALETGAVTPTQRFRVPATRVIEGYTIHDSHPHPVETMTIGDIIAASSNVGSSMLADRVGNEALAEAFGAFGFGRPTGLGFPGEASGIMPPASDWEAITRATVSFGSGVAVTPVQMASVYATVANGGEWVEPRLVAGTVDADGTVTDAPASPTRRVIRPDTADLLTRMLAYVVEDGTGYNARIEGYQVAGKTGTAKKLDEHGEYTNRYVASFIGFLPARNPRVVVATILDEPDTVYGGVAAAPLFQDIARFAIQRLAIPPAPPVDLPPHVQALP